MVDGGVVAAGKLVPINSADWVFLGIRNKAFVLDIGVREQRLALVQVPLFLVALGVVLSRLPLALLFVLVAGRCILVVSARGGRLVLALVGSIIPLALGITVALILLVVVATSLVRGFVLALAGIVIPFAVTFAVSLALGGTSVGRLILTRLAIPFARGITVAFTLLLVVATIGDNGRLLTFAVFEVAAFFAVSLLRCLLVVATEPHQIQIYKL